MEQIVYLLGAGASAQCLPVVSEMSNSISLASRLYAQTTQFFMRQGNTNINHQHAQQLLQELDWLEKECNIQTNFSIDTYAKKLKLSGKIPEYERLKNVLALYFTLQQKFKQTDVRYDNFWATLLDTKDSFPKNLKILSWNYDFQLEISYQDFLNTESLKDSANKLKVITPQTQNIKESLANEFCVFKINGSATFTSEVKKSSEYIVDGLKNKSLNEVIEKITQHYSSIISNNELLLHFNNHLSYAWEHNFESEFYNLMSKTLADTTILVVIGYSFPYFNRKQDKKILNDFMPRLKKVYFQDLNPENLKERFTAINEYIPSTSLVGINSVDQFYFPNEL
ncbi:MAG: hypothetical protein ACTHNW_08825 [Mucilaginibacter sp.]